MYPEDPPDFIFGPADNDFVPPLEEIRVRTKQEDSFVSYFKQNVNVSKVFGCVS